MPLFIIFILIISIIFFFFLSALILLGLTKLFKVQDTTYRNSIKILLFFGIVSFLIELFFSIFKPLVDLNFLFIFIEGIIIFFVFHYFFKRYYQNGWKKSLGIYIGFSIISIILALIIIIPIRAHITEPFIVSSKSMSPTYDEGDYLLINKLSNKFDRYDIIVAYNPKKQNQFIIKRIVGLPSEKVEIKNGDVFINGKVLNEGHVTKKTTGDIVVILDNNQYFVLGDNRDENSDSRFFGPISINNIKGKVFYKIFDFAK